MNGEISASELKTAQEESEPVIVDIRGRREYKREHISGSINIPLGELPTEIERLSDADHVVTVCPHGKASIRAAKLINSFEGFNGYVDSLGCGLTGWDGPTDSTTTGSNTTEDAPF